MRSIRYALVAALLAGSTPSAWSQTQPAAAENEQNEVLNLNKPVDGADSQFSILRTNDKAEINHYVSEVVELKNAVAFEILPHVLKAVTREKGTARTMKYTDPDGKTRYFMQIITTESQMPSIVATVKALDLPGAESSEGDVKAHYRMRYRRASEVASIIASTTLSGEGRVSADDATNTVFIVDSVSDGSRNAVVAEFYDVPSPQVEFEVLAVEISEDNADRLGLDWDAWKTAVGGQIGYTGNVIEGSDSYSRLDNLVTVDARALASFLNYTVQTGTGKAVTRTTVTASNNRAGIVSSLKRVPSYGYLTTVQTAAQLREPVVRGDKFEGLDSRSVAIAPPTRSFLQDTSLGSDNPGASSVDPSKATGDKAEGIFLQVQPTIGTDMVTANFRVVVNSLVGTTKLDDPIITENLVDTTVTLKDAEAFSLGGLDKETVVDTRRGIPGLKDIPVLKYLFSVESKQNRHSKVYVVVTPRFRNQVDFASRTLISSKLEATPGVTVNKLEAPAIEGVEEKK